ncbi:Nucleolar MIF4G domain-containing protein 1 [Geodia barretti]|uniref:Nucleolar MIF4G domain-containing protein 1 n=1 Tax=Geodia barretti TaxID=519541 RepID=A0AA35S400_GEOBA|nr:Nucleolar MIF4G domain-containing protein 1 [Geodia barretti]
MSQDIILQIQSKAAASTVKESSRTRFMLETITALKTNNSRKIPNYDPSLLEHMRRLMRGLLHSKGPADENQLKISLSDLLNADQQGRWWVVGSAWTGRESTTPAASSSACQSVTAESWVMELARNQRMNTEVRRNIFCVLMTSEDCVDAFEKLLRLGLKDRQEREIVHVLVDCCLQERQFNPYYAFLGQKFCECSRTHQVTFQYCLWDRLKTLSDMTSFARGNLHQLLTHLVMSQALSLSVLRVVEFTELSEAEELKFYRKLLHTLLACCSQDTCKAIFSRISVQPHLKPFRDSLLLFMKHHLSSSPSSPSSLPRTSQILQDRLELVELIMRTQQPII